jgi:hypothetical protein
MSRFLAIPEEWLDSEDTHHRLLIWIAKRATALGYGRCEAGQVTFSIREVAQRFDIPTSTAHRWVARVVSLGLLKPTLQAKKVAGCGEVYDLAGLLRLAVLPGERNKERNMERTKNPLATKDLPRPVEQEVEQEVERLKESTSTHQIQLATPNPQGGTGDLVLDLIREYNLKAEETGLAYCNGLHGAYLQKARVRVEEPGWTEKFHELLGLVHLDKFYAGENQPGKKDPWKANLMFFVREPGNVQRHLDRLKASLAKKGRARDKNLPRAEVIPLTPPPKTKWTPEEEEANERILQELYADMRKQLGVSAVS